MGERHILGWGAGWSHNTVASDDAIGLFKWLLSVNQTTEGKIRPSFIMRKAIGGDTGIGGDSFKPDIQIESMDWESDGVKGVLCEVACVAHSDGANGTWAIKMSSEGTSEIETTWSNDPDFMTWEFKFFVTAGEDGCPNIKIIDGGHNATKSENDFYWGDSLNKGVVPEQSLPPQVCIAPSCLVFLDGLIAGEKLPLATDYDVTDGIFDTAAEP